MPKDKVVVSLEIECDHETWLQEIARKFELPDASKALRVLLDYAMEEADAEEIFDMNNARCLHCG